MAKNRKSKMAAAAILNFGKSIIFGINYTCIANVDLEIGPEMAEIHLFMCIQGGGRRPSWNYTLFILDVPRRHSWWDTFSLPVA